MPTDAQLLNGDARRFAAFYRRHEDAVLGYFLRRTRSAELAADLTAETFARALEGRARFDGGRGDAGAWLFGIAHNVLTRSLDRGRVEDDVRRRLSMQPLVLDDEAIARIEAVGDERALVALPPNWETTDDPTPRTGTPAPRRGSGARTSAPALVAHRAARYRRDARARRQRGRGGAAAAP